MLFNQFKLSSNQTESISLAVPQVIDDISKEEIIIVDIKGEVNHPDVYQMTSQDRILNVIDKAGGLTSNADTTTINLSAKVVDEMMIYIPNKLEKVNETSQIATHSQQDKININQANLNELQNIPGIGATKAQSIIEYRHQHRFHKIEEIKEIEGIGDKLFERIKNKIAV